MLPVVGVRTLDPLEIQIVVYLLNKIQANHAIVGGTVSRYFFYTLISCSAVEVINTIRTKYLIDAATVG